MKQPVILSCLLALCHSPAQGSDEHINEHAAEHWFERSDLDFRHAANRNDMSVDYRYLGGPDYNKLLLHFKADGEDEHLAAADTELMVARPVGDWGLAKAGLDYRDHPSHAWSAAIGYEYLFPGFLASDLTVYPHAGSIRLKLDLQRPTAITSRLSAIPGIEARYATASDSSLETGKGWYRLEPFFRLQWKFTPTLNAYTEYRLEKSLGDVRQQLHKAGDDPDRHQWNTGLLWMF